MESALDRLKSLAAHVTGIAAPHHPLDPLAAEEISAAVAIIRKERTESPLFFNAISLWEPRKKDMLAWLESPSTAPRPRRCADVVCIGAGSKVYDGVVDLEEQKIISWDETPGVQPLITMEDLQIVELVVRKDEKVIEQCGILGIPREDMHKVYCDREYNPTIRC